MKKIEQYYVPFFMAIFMSCLMSFIFTLMHQGYDSAFWLKWLQSWGMAFIVALPCVLVVSPLVHSLSDYLKR